MSIRINIHLIGNVLLLLENDKDIIREFINENSFNQKLKPGFQKKRFYRERKKDI